MRWLLSAIVYVALTKCAVSEHHQHNRQHKRQHVVTKNTAVSSKDISLRYGIQSVIIYVDNNKRPVSTSTVFRNEVASTELEQASSPTPRSVFSATPPSNVVATTKPVPGAGRSPELLPNGSKTPQSSSGRDDGGNDGGDGFALGISYTPYTATKACKSESDVAKDLADFNGYKVLRLYGTDCNQVSNVLKATKHAVSIFAGIQDIGNVDSEVETLASAVNGNWKLIIAVGVGNELVNGHKASVDEVKSAIGRARSALKKRGYNGPVVTVDTMVAMEKNPALCIASDFCAINCHAFFDGNSVASDAGPFVANWVKKVSEAAGGKKTIVTESGWPSQGKPNQKAIPGKPQHEQAIQSLKGSFPRDLILFSLYNEFWKENRDDTHEAENYWGIKGNAPSH